MFILLGTDLYIFCIEAVKHQIYALTAKHFTSYVVNVDSQSRTKRNVTERCNDSRLPEGGTRGSLQDSTCMLYWFNWFKDTAWKPSTHQVYITDHWLPIHTCSVIPLAHPLSTNRLQSQITYKPEETRNCRCWFTQKDTTCSSNSAGRAASLETWIGAWISPWFRIETSSYPYFPEIMVKA